MQRSAGSIHSELMIMLKRVWLKICASTGKLIARYFGEQSLLSSMFGTIKPMLWSVLLGSANSAFIPQMTVVLPILTNAEPSALEMQLLFIIVDRNSSNSRPSGLTFFSRWFRRNLTGFMALNGNQLMTLHLICLINLLVEFFLRHFTSYLIFLIFFVENACLNFVNKQKFHAPLEEEEKLCK